MHKQALDANGNPLADDDIIPSGGRIRVALPFMDHVSEEVRRALGLADQADLDPQGFLRGHRPGFATALKDDAVVKARDRYIRRLNDGWKQRATPEVKTP